LTFSLNVTNARDAVNSLKLDVKYLGQNVAELSIKDGEVTISTSPKKEIDNKKAFGCEIKLNSDPWNGDNARKFREYFAKEKPENKLGYNEKRIESLLLTEFANNMDKALRNIKPVMIEGIYFPMPTPLSASKKGEVKYARSGGGIDIFARTGTGGRNTHLCVIEVKDENANSKQNESPPVVITQAIKYATFIRALIRSDAGASWWKLFGFGGEVPSKLLIHAVCAMPADNPDKSFARKRLVIKQDEIQLDYIYFTESENVIKNIETSLPYGNK